jgi:hypothetical protein
MTVNDEQAEKDAGAQFVADPRRPVLVVMRHTFIRW